MSLALPDLLVSTDWLGANLADPDLRVFDCSVTLVPAGAGMRPESGRAAWERGHVPAADSRTCSTTCRTNPSRCPS